MRICLGIDVCAMVLNMLQSTFTGDYALSNLASLFTVAAIIIAPIAFFTKRWLNKKTERAEVSKSLHEELKDALEALDGTAGRQVMEIEVGGDKKYYTLTFMNYDMYDSLIFSGKIQALNHDLQQKIQDIFRRIKGHQEYFKYATQLSDNAKLAGKNMDKTTISYYELLATYETELEQLIPDVMKELEKNFSSS